MILKDKRVMNPNLIHWSSLPLRQGVLLVLSALLLRPEAARAEIVFSGQKDIAIPTNFDGVYINISNGQSGSSPVSGWDLNPFFGGLFIANSPNFQPVRSGEGSEDAIVRLAATSVIGGSSTFSSDWGGSGAEGGQGHLGTNPSQFADGKAGYMGFKLLSGAGAPVYGWMSVVFTENGNNGMIRSWAYENNSTIGSIKVGATGEAGQRVVSGELAPVTANTAGDSILMEAGGKLTFQEVGQQGSFSGKIEGAGEIVINGAGGLRLNGSNTFSGTASVLGGSKLTVTKNDNLGGALVKLGRFSKLIFDSNAANNGTANKFTNDIALDGDGATLRNSGDGVVELAGAIDGSGDLIKDGAGDMKLTGNSTYTGNTVVNDGKLVVNGSISTSMLTVVNEGGALGGSGSTGALTVNAGAVLTPGNSPGNLQIDGDFTLGGAYVWELASFSTAGPGTNYDTVTINLGNADITGASLNLSLGDYAPSGIAFWQTDQVWERIINNVGSGTLTGFFASIDNSSWSTLGYFSTFNIGNDVNLVWTAIPETHTALLGSLGMLVLLGRRSRDKSRGF
jgi:autotransporter-associated beta strand protein